MVVSDLQNCILLYTVTWWHSWLLCTLCKYFKQCVLDRHGCFLSLNYNSFFRITHHFPKESTKRCFTMWINSFFSVRPTLCFYINTIWIILKTILRGNTYYLVCNPIKFQRKNVFSVFLYHSLEDIKAKVTTNLLNHSPYKKLKILLTSLLSMNFIHVSFLWKFFIGW